MSYREVLKRGERFLEGYHADTLAKRAARKAAFVVTGLFAKTMLSYAYNTKVDGLGQFHEAYRQSKLENRGLITVMNHVSVMDEPLCWGMLPLEHVLNPRHMRWTLGADNICFKNKGLSTFFRAGQVLSTQRFGAGIFQGSIDAAVSLLSPTNTSYTPGKLPEFVYENHAPTSRWVHMFPEAVVHQVEAPYNNTLRYFKWGVSRLILESTRPPIVLPIFAKGMENSLSENNPTYYPVTGVDLEYSFGEPMDEKLVAGLRQEWLELAGKYPMDGEMPEQVKSGDEANQLRSKVASAVRDAVMQARGVYEHLPADDPRFADPVFWRNPQGVTMRVNTTGRHMYKQKEGK